MLDKEKLAERLRMERARKRVTQKQVADATGTTDVAICRYEAGTRVPTINKLMALAEYYDVSLEYLTGQGE